MHSILLVISIFSFLFILPAGAESVAAVAYTPVQAPCPPGTKLVRLAGTHKQSLSPGESAYISAKQNAVAPTAWNSYLQAVQQSTRSSLPSYVHDILSGRYGSAGFPKVAIAVSGGGYRAAIFGAGVLHALDGRNAQSVEVGTGGLLQATSYLSGLSGGSWLVGSLAQANFPTIPDLIFGTANDSTDAYDEYPRLPELLSQEEYLIPRALAGTPNASVDTFGSWLTDIDFVEPSIDSEVTEAYILSIEEEVVGKEDAGFPVSDTDFQGRLFSRHFVNGTDAADFFDTAIAHGTGITFSSIANVTSFKAYAQPFPILVSDSLSQHGDPSTMLNWTGVVVPLTNPIYEMNVFEMGSFDPMLSAFIPMQYLGTSNDSICVTNFDQVCFVESMSSSLVPNATAAGALIPNPFMGIAKDTFIDTNETILHLVDGSSDGEFVPIQPFLVKARGIDVILAVDAGNQTHGNETNNNFADGSSLIATQDRAALYPSYYSFPPVPTLYTTFLAQNLTKRPTFFGCDTDPSAPLVIYLANGAAPLGQSPVTNISSARSSIPSEEVEAMLAQTFDITTQGIPIETHVHGSSVLEKDPMWPACLACAVVDRARQREGMQRSGVCTKCMTVYCWS